MAADEMHQTASTTTAASPGDRADTAVPRPAARGTIIRSDLSILLVAIIWGSSYVVMQTIGERLPAASFLTLRFLTALPAVLMLAGPSLRRLSRTELQSGAIFGTLLYGILILETVGVQHTSAANAGFLITVSVVLVPLFERLSGGRSQPLIVYAATAVALSGCGLLLLHRGIHPQSGDLIVLAAAMIRATQITLFGRRTSGQSLQNITTVEFVVVTFLAGCTSALSGHPVWSVIGQVDGQSWLLIAYLGVLGSSFAFYAQLRSARLSSSTRVGLILCTEPVFATFFALVVAGETIVLGQAVGGSLMVLSAVVGRAAETSGRLAARPGDADGQLRRSRG